MEAIRNRNSISKRRPFKDTCDRGTLIPLHTKLPSLDRFSMIEAYSLFGTLIPLWEGEDVSGMPVVSRTIRFLTSDGSTFSQLIILHRHENPAPTIEPYCQLL